MSMAVSVVVIPGMISKVDVSRVVLPLADEAGEAETHRVLGTFSAVITLLIYAVGTSYVLSFEWTNRGP